MNKIKGSWLLKLLGWIFATISVIGLGICISAFISLEVFHVYDTTIETTQNNAYQHITERLANQALYQSNADNEAINLSKEGFKYAILSKKDFVNNNFSNLQYTTLTQNINLKNLEVVDCSYNSNLHFVLFDDYIYKSFYLSDYRPNVTQTYCSGIIYYEPTGLFYYMDNDYNYYIAKNVTIDLEYQKYIEQEEFSDAEESEAEESEAFVEIEAFTGTDEAEEFEEIEEAESADYMHSYLYLVYDEELNCYTYDGEIIYPYDYYDNWYKLLFDMAWKVSADRILLIPESSKLIDANIDTTAYAYLNKNGTLCIDTTRSDSSDYVVLADVNNKLWSHQKTKTISELWHHILLSDDEMSDYEYTDNIILIMYSIKNKVFPVGICFGILLILCCIYLFTAAGHRKNQEGIVLTIIDKLPLEIYLAIMWLLFLLPIMIIYTVGESGCSLFVIVNVLILMSILSWLVFLWFILGAAVRIKNKNFFKNSITYVVLRWCYRLIKKLINKIRDYSSYIKSFWIIALSIAVLIILDIACYDSAEDGLFIFMIFVKIILSLALLKLLFNYKQLKETSDKIAKGDLSYQINTKSMLYDQKQFAQNLNNINDGLNHAVDEKIKSERMKTELITNVSHDIKTPLTSIINYVDLLQKEEINNATVNEYLAVLARQSARLKKLIEDLVEASKASSGNLAVNIEKLDATVIISQVAGEFEEKLQKENLELIIRKPEPPVEINADGRHLWRVLDNLMNNICKYAQAGSRVYLDLEQDENQVRIILRNISRYQLEVSADELMERFVRGDSSRNTEGHGLGLAIAKSLMELMKGSLDIHIDGDLFKVILTLQK